MFRAIKRQLDQTGLLNELKSIYLNLRTLASLSPEIRLIAFRTNTTFYYTIPESKDCFSSILTYSTH